MRMQDANLYYTLNPVQRMARRLRDGFVGAPRGLWNAIKAFGRWIARCARELWDVLRELCAALRHGDLSVKGSFLLMGLGCLCHKQMVKGLLYLLAEGLFIAYMALFGWEYLAKFGTLGTAVKRQVWDEELQIYVYEQGDNSMLILLFGVLTLLLIALFLILYANAIRAGFRAQQLLRQGERPAAFREELRSLLDSRFHWSLLSLPVLLVTAFTVLPLLFMILIAFTNFDTAHQPPGNLFTWVGWQNFRELLWDDPVKSHTLWSLLGWTLTWAVFATFTNYIFGIILSLMINKKGIRLKKMWRTIFVVTIAVPQFVTLLFLSQLLHEQGALNTLLLEWGWIDQPIRFLTDATLARVTVIVVNMWVGIPYTLLIATGILLNIPEELYESARIDGAGPVRTFFRITLPYMLFVTTPYLITQFVGNINNFNLIFLLTGGEPSTLEYFRAGKTDLLVTWLYKQTVNFQNYNVAAAIGIIVFILSAVFSLLVYNRSGSARREGEFA